MENFCTLDNSEKTIAALGDRWWPQKTKQEGDKISKITNVIYEKKVVASVGGVSVGSERSPVSKRMRDQWSNDLRQATNEYPPPLCRSRTTLAVGG